MMPFVSRTRASNPLVPALLALLAAAWIGGFGAPVLAQPSSDDSTTGQDVEPPAESASVEPIDLNQASEQQLRSLPGIGPSRARAIVVLRERLGGFRHVRQLLRVKGIGRATFRRIRPLVTVGPRPERHRDR